jgi:hypothetical protein
MRRIRKSVCLVRLPSFEITAPKLRSSENKNDGKLVLADQISARRTSLRATGSAICTMPCPGLLCWRTRTRPNTVASQSLSWRRRMLTQGGLTWGLSL